MHRKFSTPNRPTRSDFTADFPGSPFRVAYSYIARCHVVVEVATDETVEIEGAQAAYELAAALNYAVATKAALLACPTCGGDGSPCVDCNPVDLAALVPDPDAWVAVSAVPCAPVDPDADWRQAEAELDRIDAELSARCACYATGTEQPACLARGTSCDREARRVRWLARQEQMRATARQLGLLGTLDPCPVTALADLPHIAATAHISLTCRIELRRGFHGYLAVQVDEDAQGYASGYLRTFGDEDEARQWVSDEAVRQARAARALAS